MNKYAFEFLHKKYLCLVIYDIYYENNCRIYNTILMNDNSWYVFLTLNNHSKCW